MLQLCKLCLMLGLCDYAKKQCWHNRAAPMYVRIYRVRFFHFLTEGDSITQFFILPGPSRRRTAVLQPTHVFDVFDLAHGARDNVFDLALKGPQDVFDLALKNPRNTYSTSPRRPRKMYSTSL